MKKKLIVILLLCVVMLAQSCNTSTGSEDNETTGNQTTGADVIITTPGESEITESTEKFAEESAEITTRDTTDAEPEQSTEPADTNPGTVGDTVSETEAETENPELKYTAPTAEPQIPDKENPRKISVAACSFTSEEDICVIIGRCEKGVTVRAETSGGSDESESYMGWFSVRVRCPGVRVTVKLTQWYENGQVGDELSYRAQPVQPGDNMWGVLAGRNYQFFLEKELPDFLGENILSQSRLDEFRNTVSKRVSSAEKVSEGCEIIYMIVPSPMSVYPENVPDAFTGADVTRYTQITAALKEAGAVVIDLKSAFDEHKNDSIPLYYLTDSHWTEYGAYIAYKELFEYISQRFPDAAPRGYDDFIWEPSYYVSGDITYYLEMPQEDVLEYSWLRSFRETSDAISSIERYKRDDTLAYAGYSNQVINEGRVNTGNDKLPDIFVMRDSYTAQLYDIVSERCNNSHWMSMWSYSFNTAAIRRDKPDYIIYIVSEWDIDGLLE